MVCSKKVSHYAVLIRIVSFAFASKKIKVFNKAVDSCHDMPNQLFDGIMGMAIIQKNQSFHNN